VVNIFYGIEVMPGNKAKLSYYLNKVDNVDMVSNNIRLIDSSEKLNS